MGPDFYHLTEGGFRLKRPFREVVEIGTSQIPFSSCLLRGACGAAAPPHGRGVPIGKAFRRSPGSLPHPVFGATSGKGGRHWGSLPSLGTTSRKGRFHWESFSAESRELAPTLPLGKPPLPRYHLTEGGVPLGNLFGRRHGQLALALRTVIFSALRAAHVFFLRSA